MADKQAPTTFPEVLKLQQELRANFEAQMDALRPKRKLTPDDLIASRKADLDKTRAAMAQVEKQRDASAKVWDDRIARLKKRAEQQAADIGVVKEAAKESAKGATRTAAPKAAPGKKK